MQPIVNTVIYMSVTFMEAAGAVFVLQGYKLDKLAIGGCVGAGLSAVWNVILKPYFKKQGWLK